MPGGNVLWAYARRLRLLYNYYYHYSGFVHELKYSTLESWLQLRADESPWYFGLEIPTPKLLCLDLGRQDRRICSTPVWNSSSSYMILSRVDHVA